MTDRPMRAGGIATLGVAVDDVDVRYRSTGEDVMALREVGFAADGPGLVALAGPSGAGKSTLLRLLAGFDQPTHGSVHVGDAAMHRMSERRRRLLRRRSIAVIHQRPLSNLLADLTAAQHIEFACAARRLARPSATECSAALARFGLGAVAGSLPHHLSGGEQQRLALAMSVAARLPLLLADEPTAELDGASAVTVIEALRAAASDGQLVIVATHDERMIAAADRAVHLRNGRLA